MTSALTPHSSYVRIRRPIALTLFALSGWLMSPAAFAQPATGLDLRWAAPVGCPQQSDVGDRVTKLTGSVSATQGPLEAEGTVSQTDNGRFHLKLVMRSGGLVGERNLDSTSCADLAGAAAVTLALLMRSEAPLSERDLGGRETPNATPTPASSAATSNTTPASPAATGTSDRVEPEHPRSEQPEARPEASSNDRTQSPSRTSQRPWRMVIQAPVATLSLGPLPRPSWGVALGAGVSYESWRFLIQGAEWLRQNMPAKDIPGYGADIDRATVTLRTCRAQRASVFELAPCVVLSLERVSARGTGAHVAPRSEQATLLGVGAGAQGRLYLARWFSLTVGVDAQIETSRPQLSIDGVGAVGQLGPAAFTVVVGPEWIL
jgi:hypothetical protein